MTLGVSRRAVQGYEKKGLVSASDRTEKGYLLYDSDAYERISLIKQYQDFGFSLDEIKLLVEASPDEVRVHMESQLEKLKSRLSNLNDVVIRAEEFIKNL